MTNSTNMKQRTHSRWRQSTLANHWRATTSTKTSAKKNKWRNSCWGINAGRLGRWLRFCKGNKKTNKYPFLWKKVNIIRPGWARNIFWSNAPCCLFDFMSATSSTARKPSPSSPMILCPVDFIYWLLTYNHAEVHPCHHWASAPRVEKLPDRQQGLRYPW